MNTLISVAELATQLANSDLVILDCSFYLQNENRDAFGLFVDAHIPGARFLDIDVVSDRESPLPHMVPDASRFSAVVETLGVSNGSTIVIYDQRGLFSAARAWWLFTVFGHEDVFVLDGGLPKWRELGHPLQAGPAEQPRTGRFAASLDRSFIRAMPDILENIDTKTELLVDARAAGRFAGTIAEPRPGMRSGHVPGALSLPFTTLLEADGTMKPPADIRRIFGSIGIDGSATPVTMCGSGVTGTVLTLGLVHAGLPMGALYDGSWAEWGRYGDTPIESNAHG